MTHACMKFESRADAARFSLPALALASEASGQREHFSNGRAGSSLRSAARPGGWTREAKPSEAGRGDASMTERSHSTEAFPHPGSLALADPPLAGREGASGRSRNDSTQFKTRMRYSGAAVETAGRSRP